MTPRLPEAVRAMMAGDDWPQAEQVQRETSAPAAWHEAAIVAVGAVIVMITVWAMVS